MKSIICKLWMVGAILCLSISASAYDLEVNGIYYNIFASSKTAKVTHGENKYSGNLSIPESISYSGYNLSVVGIDDYAFADCSSIISINLSNTIETIGSNAFSGCSSLASISLPDMIKSIGSESFKNCSSLITIKLSNSITYIPYGLFEGCTSLVSIDLPSSVTSVGSNAFSGCSSLVSIDLPSNLTSIGDYAFSGCSSLTSIELPSKLTSIGEHNGPFKNCSSLLEIVLPDGITTIPQYAFDGCSALSKITLSNNPTYISESSLRGCISLEEIGNMNSARYSSSGPGVFWDCENLKELVVGNGLTGFPFDYSYTKNGLYAGSYANRTFDSQIRYQSYGGGSVYENYLQNLKRIIIEDSEKEFSIKVSFDASGDHSPIPAFSKIDLEYFYVGRPIIDNKEFEYMYNDTNFAGQVEKKYRNYRVKVAQGYGHVGTLEIGGHCTEVPYFYQKIDTLILGKKIHRLDMDNIYMDDLSIIICKNNIPPTISNINKVPSDNYLKTKVLVPYGCKEAYSNAVGWENFWNIEEMEEIQPETIVLNIYEIKLNIFDEFKLEATVLPDNTSNRNIVWVSSNESIASISNDGLVTALKEGETTISASCGDVSTECKVCVVDNSSVESIFDNSYELFTVYTLNGILIQKDCNKDFLNELDKGIYIVKKGEQTIKISIK